MVWEMFIKPAVDLVRELGSSLVSIRKERQGEIDAVEAVFGPTSELSEWYIVPDGQNINPADLAEDENGFVSREGILEMFARFVKGPDRVRHAFILADAGMGKSSLFIMLKLFYLGRFLTPGYEIQLFKLGPESLKQIGKIKNPGRTVLLLDALDEDSAAWLDFQKRLSDIFDITKNFKKVVISCRTQFFPMEMEEETKIPGIISMGGFLCSKVFLSPFSDQQVKNYLGKRFSDTKELEKAWSIVNHMQSLKFRPMLLAHVDLLLEAEGTSKNSFFIYQELMRAWIRRELEKGIIKEKKLLWENCMAIAWIMYESQAWDVHPDALKEISQKVDWVGRLEAMSVEGRSLLHRTSSGNYKFAHASIMEFLVAVAVFQGKRPSRYTDQVKKFIIDALRGRDVLMIPEVPMEKFDLSRVDLSGMNLSNLSLDGVDFSEAVLKGCVFRNNKFGGTIFFKADLRKADFERGDLKSVGLVEADLRGAELTFADMRNSNLEGADLRRCRAGGSDMGRANLKNANLEETSFMRRGARNGKYTVYDPARLKGAKTKDARMPLKKSKG